MKILCNKCGKEKDISCFSKNKKKRGYHSWCKECVKEYDHNRHKNNKERIRKQHKDRRVLIREWFNDYKSTLECEECGENHLAALDFHHLDQNEKERSISNMINSFSIENIKKEIDKCVVLCANCHRKLHFENKHR